MLRQTKTKKKNRLRDETYRDREKESLHPETRELDVENRQVELVIIICEKCLKNAKI